MINEIFLFLPNLIRFYYDQNLKFGHLKLGHLKFSNCPNVKSENWIPLNLKTGYR